MSKGYFNSLNYTMGNEDSFLEFKVVPNNANHIVAVAGSGSRVVPLLAKHPQHITCVDSSIEQLSLTELRIATIQKLSHTQFLAFWGYTPKNMTTTERKEIFNTLNISSRAKKTMHPIFKAYNWHSLLYAGKWENTFKKLSKINRLLIGKKGLGIFDCVNQKDQEKYLKTIFPHKAWSIVVFLLGNAVVFNTLLYKGRFPKRNIKTSLHSFYIERFQRLFKQDIVRKNYFLQLLFFGKLMFTEGLPAECELDIFTRAKVGLQNTNISYVYGNIINEVQSVTQLIDFLSLSDVPSYLSAPQEQNFMQDIRKHMSPNGIVVNRYYLRTPENLQTAGYINITNNFKKIIEQERIQMYYFGIYKKTGI